MSDKLGKDESEINLVVAHLGSGGSVCLIQGGESRNTTMGVTPLEGMFITILPRFFKWKICMRAADSFSVKRFTGRN